MKNKIVLVPFPFDDLSGTKVRPALCLTDTISAYNHVIICFITSQLDKSSESSDIPLLSSDKDFIQTGLKVDSAIRLHRLVTIPKFLIKKQLGVLPIAYQSVLKSKLQELFNI